jgi:hypothetical protein
MFIRKHWYPPTRLPDVIMWRTIVLIRKWIVATQFRNVVPYSEEEKILDYENILTYEISLAIMGHAA